MKNLTISKKLIIGFGSILIMLLIIIGVSLYSISNINDQIHSYAKYTLPNSTSVWILRRNDVSIQRYISRALSETDTQKITELFEAAQQDCDARTDELEKYAANQRDTSRDAHIAELRELWSETRKIRLKIAELMKNPTESNVQQAREMLDNNYLPISNQATEILAGFTKTADERAVRQEQNAVDSVQFARTLLMLCGAVAVALSILLMAVIRKSILTPVNEIVDAYGKIAKGNLKSEIKYESRDELGQMAVLIQKTNAMQNEIVGDVIDKFTKISYGDFRFQMDLEYPGDYAALKQTIIDTIFTLNNTLLNINSAAEQVSAGSDQVAAGAQALSQGATEQASSVEELTATIMEISSDLKKSTDSARQARLLSEEAGIEVAQSNQQMRQLTTAMDEISTASHEIGKIIKAIDDIAFQTNILALNAAVEAARAGAAGKGFAVVADEVRNLAAKSAEAAKSTTLLIESTLNAIETGEKLANATASSLQNVVEKTQTADERVQEIASDIEREAMSVSQIASGIDQISAVIQTNSATAEESAAASEELSGQAQLLKQLISKFQLSETFAETNY